MKNNSLQKKITKNQLLQKDTQLIRVLDIEADRVFVIDCIKKTMPVWKDTESINEYCQRIHIKYNDKNSLVDYL